MGTGVALTSGLLLDTHTWLWLESGTLTAIPEVIEEIRQATHERKLMLCSFSLTEVAHQIARKRLTLARPLLSWFQNSLRPPGPLLLDISPEIATATVHLPETFHGDPGDRILAATAIVHGLTICTHDDLLLRFGKQGLFRSLKVNEVKEKHAR